MTPKEEAELLVNTYFISISKESNDGAEIVFLNAKKCALICVNEKDLIYQRLTPKDDPYCFLFEMEYLQEVKQEIQKL